MIRSVMGLALVSIGFGLLTLAGCGTGTPGMTNTLGAFELQINGPPDKVTDAAVDAVTDLGLTSIAHSNTKVDGTVTAKTARNEDVKISIDQSGDGSDVTIKVGSYGDEAISTQIFNKIRANRNKPSAPIEGGGLK
jgi:hypothetical protein